MNARFFVLAFTAALNLKLLAIDLLLIENRRPRAMFLCLLLGGFAVGITVGMLDVLVFHLDAIKSQKQSARASIWPSACFSSRSGRWSPPAACTAGASSQSRPGAGRPTRRRRRRRTAGPSGYWQSRGSGWPC